MLVPVPKEVLGTFSPEIPSARECRLVGPPHRYLKQQIRLVKTGFVNVSLQLWGQRNKERIALSLTLSLASEACFLI